MIPQRHLNALAAFCVLFIGTLLALGNSGSTALASETADVRLLGTGCNDCPGVTCQSSEHAVEFFQPVELGTEDGLHDCQFGSCEAHGHTFVQCDGGEDAQALLSALATASISEVEDLIASHHATALYHPDREAMQVVGCNGDIVAHIPMNRPN